MKSVQNTLVILILTLSVISCKKEEKHLFGSTNTTPSMTIPQGAPTNNGVQLEFQDQQHFEDWFDYLETELDQPTNTDDDSLLNIIETNDLMNFHSLRNDVLIRNGLDDPNAEFTLEEIDLLMPCDLMGDDILKSILNEYHEVIIGNMLYVYFPGSNIIGTNKNNITGINALRDVDKCSSDNKLYKDFLYDPAFEIFLSSSNRSGSRS